MIVGRQLWAFESSRNIFFNDALNIYDFRWIKKLKVRILSIGVNLIRCETDKSNLLCPCQGHLRERFWTYRLMNPLRESWAPSMGSLLQKKLFRWSHPIPYPEIWVFRYWYNVCPILKQYTCSFERLCRLPSIKFCACHGRLILFSRNIDAFSSRTCRNFQNLTRILNESLWH